MTHDAEAPKAAKVAAHLGRSSIAITAGEIAGAKVGDVYAVGPFEDVCDPTTGEVLGRVSVRRLIAMVGEVRERFSLAVVESYTIHRRELLIDPASKCKPGDDLILLRREKPAEPTDDGEPEPECGDQSDVPMPHELADDEGRVTMARGVKGSGKPAGAYAVILERNGQEIGSDDIQGAAHSWATTYTRRTGRPTVVTRRSDGLKLRTFRASVVAGVRTVTTEPTGEEHDYSP